MTLDPSSQEFFEAKYAASADPWNFAESAYERARYDKTIEALGDRRYSRAFEPGCSVGALTARLARHCAQVEAIDISSSAIQIARERCQGIPNVHFVQGRLPEMIPPGKFDLIVFSEIGYYFDVDELDVILCSLTTHLPRDAVFLAVHWLGNSADHRISGDTVHQRIHQLPHLKHSFTFRHEASANECYCLDRWIRQ
jgi:SAM-dependent methyltransferase